MAIFQSWRRRVSAGLTALPSSWTSVLAFGLAVVVSAVAGDLDAERQSAEERSRTLNELALARAQVEGVLKATFNSTDGLAHLIALQNGIEPPLFADMARLAIGKNPHVRNITVAPDDQVTMVYPQQGNEKVLGFRFADNPEQYRTVRLARERGASLLAGPVALVQGGRALIQRTPVFTSAGDETRYWGTLSIVANIDSLLHTDNLRSIRVAIRGKDALGADGGLVHGDASVFAQNPLQMDIQVPGGSWRMAAAPLGGWQPHYFYTSPYFHLGLAISLLLALLTGVRAQYSQRLHERNHALEEEMKERRRIEAALGEEEERFRTLFDSSPDPAWILEGNRMIKCNPAALDVFGYGPDDDAVFSHPARLSPPWQPDGQPSREAAEAMMARVHDCGSLRFEWLHQRSNGELFYAEVTLTAIGMRGKSLVHAVVRDISARKEAEQALCASRNLLQTIIESAGALIYVFDADGRLKLCNPQFEALCNRAREDMLGLRRHAFLPSAIADQHEHNDSLVMARGEQIEFEESIVADGQPRVYLSVKRPLRENGAVTGVVGISTDITERKAAEEALRLYANIFEQTNEAILVTDRDNCIVRVNPALEHITGYRFEELRGHNPRMLASGNTPVSVYRELWQALHTHGHWQGELWDRRKDGAVYPKWTNLSVLRDANGEITHYLGLFTDITERKHAEARIEHLAHHDKLTGLFNRHSLQERLGQALAGAAYAGGRLAVMFIDLDRFKIINDTLGHHVGDQLLGEVAARLRQVASANDIVARLGGDEFVVVLANDESAREALPIACQILAALGAPYLLDGNQLHSTPSIGISIYPDDGDSVDALMKAADTAMYHAKAQGRNNVQFFTTEMNAAAAERMELERDLHHAMAHQQLEIHYQPQVEAASGRVCGVEALLRWPHPTRGQVSPLKFIPIAEESGLIEALGAWVLRQACQQVANWKTIGIHGVRMAVNLSAHQLRSRQLVSTVREAMEAYGVDAGELELEITESAVMKEPEAAIDTLQQLRDLGVHLAIDDFGTGYSSLAYLKLLPVDVLKIDRSFVKDIETDRNDAAICASILALARSLGLKVVAEGVETAAQRDFLHQQGCDYLQGYFFARPQPAALCAEQWRQTRAALPAGVTG